LATVAQRFSSALNLEVNMRKLILATASVLALGIGGAGVSHAAGTGKSAPNGGATVPAPYGVTTNQLGGVNLPSSEIKGAQEKLRDQGLYHGRIDGVLGPETKQALQQFQQKNGLAVTATLDQQTMDKLSGAAQGSSMPPASTQGTGPTANPQPATPGASGIGDHSAPKQ
jgi:peptidoglycan hydrolase-like protein with peptidoglycan-binding domain